MVWALIIENTGASVKQEVADYYGVEEDELTGEDFPVIISGTKNYSAIISTLPGTEGLEMEIADRLYNKSEKKIYILYDSEIQFGVFQYADGDVRKKIDSSFDDFLKLVGIKLGPFWAPDEKQQEKSPVKTIAVIENANENSIMKLLGYEYIPDGVFIKSIANKRVLFHSEHGNVAIQAYKLSYEIPSLIYFICYNSESGNFGCTLIKNGEEMGIFQYPEYTTEDLEELEDINGAKTPAAILESLGVNASILNFPL